MCPERNAAALLRLSPGAPHTPYYRVTPPVTHPPLPVDPCNRIATANGPHPRADALLHMCTLVRGL